MEPEISYHIIVSSRDDSVVHLYGAPFSVVQELRTGVKSYLTTTEVILRDDWHVFVNKHIISISAFKE